MNEDFDDDKIKELTERINKAAQKRVPDLPLPKETSYLETRDKIEKTIPSVKVSPIRTYNNDAAEAVKEKNASIVSINLAAQRKKEEEEQEETEYSSTKKNILFIFLSLVIIGVAVGGVLWTVNFYKNKSKPEVKPQIMSLITSDEEKVINITDLTKQDLLDQIRNEKENSLSDKITNLRFTKTVSKIQKNKTITSEKNITFSELALKLEMTVPGVLERNLEPDFMLGILGGTENKLFLILKTNSFETSFGGMLAWETNIVKDVGELVGTDQSFILDSQTQTFKDQIINNRDTRSIKDNSFKTKMIYSFVDKNTILITSDEQTFNTISERIVSLKIKR